MKLLFLAWQNPDTRLWYTIGRLTETETDCYQFSYTQGALTAQREGGFCPLPSFPDLFSVYVSESLFPLFSNRLPSRSRSDYGDFVEWLSLPLAEEDPFALLARSGGQRTTDTLAAFPCPEPDESGRYHTHFFVHGLSHMTDSARARAEALQPGERLLLMRDIQNPQEPKALMLRTAEAFKGDASLLGYFPQFLVADVNQLLDLMSGEDAVVVRVERVNKAPAPVQFRLLCSVTMHWPDGFRPFTALDYEPLAS